MSIKVIEVFFTSISCFLTIILLVFEMVHGDSSITMSIFPLLYSIFLILFLGIRGFTKIYYQMTICIVFVIQFIRCVLLPVFGVLSGVYSSLNFENSSYVEAYWLMLTEEIFIWLVCFFIANQKKKQTNHKVFSLSGTYILYIVLALFAVIYYMLFGHGQKVFSFIMLDTSARVGDSNTGTSNILTSIISTAMTFMAIAFITKCHEKYLKKSERRYVYLAIFIACIMLCFIIGERRSHQIYLMFAYGGLLIALFPNYKKRIIKYVGIVALSILALMSIYKFSYAFLYGSYVEALKQSSFSLADTVRTFDSYFFGFSVLNKNIYFINSYEMPFSQFLLTLDAIFLGYIIFLKIIFHQQKYITCSFMVVNN